MRWLRRREEIGDFSGSGASPQYRRRERRAGPLGGRGLKGFHSLGLE